MKCVYDGLSLCSRKTRALAVRSSVTVQKEMTQQRPSHFSQFRYLRPIIRLVLHAQLEQMKCSRFKCIIKLFIHQYCNYSEGTMRWCSVNFLLMKRTSYLYIKYIVAKIAYICNTRSLSMTECWFTERWDDYFHTTNILKVLH